MPVITLVEHLSSPWEEAAGVTEKPSNAETINQYLLSVTLRIGKTLTKIYFKIPCAVYRSSVIITISI